MSDMLILSVDLERLAATLSDTRRRPVSRAEAESWLRDNGFEPSGGHWIAEASVAATMLNNGEIVGATALDEPEAGGALQPATFESSFEARPYIIDEQRRSALRAMPGYDACVVPSFMCGRPREVIDDWRTIARKIIRNGGFEKAMKGVQFTHIDNAPGRLVFAAYHASPTQESNVLTYPILAGLSELSYDMTKSRHSWYCVKRQLLLDGLNDFWFSLCFVANGADYWRFSMPPGYEEDRRLVSRLVIEKLIRWWPHFCARNDRFAHLSGRPQPWPAWGLGWCSIFDSDSAWKRVSGMTCGGTMSYLNSYLVDHPGPTTGDDT